VGAATGIRDLRDRRSLMTGARRYALDLFASRLLGRADIPDTGPTSILALLAYRSLRPHGAAESII
jgi:hypothetical protein